MKKITYKYKWLIILLIGLGSIISCSELDETHKEYIKDGEQIYVGRPLLVVTNSGNERIKFNIVINADPKISKGKITWNNDNESNDFTVTRNSDGFDVVEFEINIPEIKLNITSGILTENRRLPSIPERSDDVETN